MDYFEDIYLKRLNQTGFTMVDRVQHQREKEFHNLLQKSAYRINFMYQGFEQPALLERYKQDESQTLQYLLTCRDLTLTAGTIVKAMDQKGEKKGIWMILYLEDIKQSGYNRYIVIRTDLVVDIDGHKFNACLIGPGHSYMRDVIKSRAATTIYLEDFNSFLLILPKTQYIKKDTYLTIGKDWEKTGFRVTGFDLFTNPDVEYVTLDPMYIKDETEAPTKTEEDSDEDYFWLNGGR